MRTPSIRSGKILTSCSSKKMQEVAAVVILAATALLKTTMATAHTLNNPTRSLKDSSCKANLRVRLQQHRMTLTQHV
jgi:uncharacterized protein YcnI